VSTLVLPGRDRVPDARVVGVVTGLVTVGRIDRRSARATPQEGDSEPREEDERADGDRRIDETDGSSEKRRPQRRQRDDDERPPEPRRPGGLGGI
jgi:hypothetical protein